MTSECVICKSPLGQESKDLGYYHCHICRHCPVCDDDMRPLDSQYCAEHGIDPPMCCGCQVLRKIQPAADSDIAEPDTSTKGESVTISIAEYTRLNIARNICTPLDDRSNLTNQQDAVIANQRWIINMSHEQLILMMRRYEALAADCMLTLKKAKADIAGIEKLQQRAQGTALDESTATLKKQRNKQIEDAAEKQLTPLQRKQRRDRAKAIEGLTALGLDQTTAERRIDRELAIQKLMRPVELGGRGMSKTDASALVDSPNWPPTIQ